MGVIPELIVLQVFIMAVGILLAPLSKGKGKMNVLLMMIAITILVRNSNAQKSLATALMNATLTGSVSKECNYSCSDSGGLTTSDCWVPITSS